MTLQAAWKAVEYVRSGMVVGLGTGSTAAFAVDRIGQLLKEGQLKDIVGVPTSVRTFEQAKSLGIPLATLDEQAKLDVAIDGADEVRKREGRGRGAQLWLAWCLCDSLAAAPSVWWRRGRPHAAVRRMQPPALSQTPPPRSPSSLRVARPRPRPHRQVDPKLDVVKGRGGALLREKARSSGAAAGSRRRRRRCRSRRPARAGHSGAGPPSLPLPPAPQMVEMASAKFVCIVDESKLVSGLGGSKDAMPVEIVQFCHKYTLGRLAVSAPQGAQGPTASRRARSWP